MDDELGKVEVFSNHFEASEASEKKLERRNPLQPTAHLDVNSLHNRSWASRNTITAASLLKLLSRPRVPWDSNNDGDDKVEMSMAEIESLKSEIAEAEDREAYLKAQLENVDAVLSFAQLAGYLNLRIRWTTLPGELPILDDVDVDDWLPCFVVLQGPCLFYYFQSTDLSPLDTTLISDIAEVGSLPSFSQEDHKTRYAFYILTCHGLLFECSSHSKVQVDSWLTLLQGSCNLGQDTTPLLPVES